MAVQKKTTEKSGYQTVIYSDDYAHLGCWRFQRVINAGDYNLKGANECLNKVLLHI